MGISFISNYHSMSLLLLYIRFQFLAITNKAYTRFQRTYTYIHSYLLGYAQKYNCWATGLFLFLADNAEVLYFGYKTHLEYIYHIIFARPVACFFTFLMVSLNEYTHMFLTIRAYYSSFFLCLVLSACCLNYLC